MRGIKGIDKGVGSAALALLASALTLLSLFWMAGRFSIVAFAYEGYEEGAVEEAENGNDGEGTEKDSGFEDGEEGLGMDAPEGSYSTELDAWFSGGGVSGFFPDGWERELTEERSREADRTGTVVTNGGRLNLRTGAGMDYGIIDRLSPGEKVKVAGEENGWYKVVVSEKTGYVWGEYLKVSDAYDESAVDGQGSMDEEILKMLLYLMLQEAEKESPVQPPVPETDAGLEPEGNLTLVDDVGTVSKEGQQFVTLMTKAGNYFYLVIDRDKDGEENVHFLNMVDEADLMALMEDEEAEKFYAVPDGKGEAEPIVSPDAGGEMELGKAEEQPTEEESASGSMLLLFGVFVLVSGGIGGFLFMQTRKKKQKEQAKPDPDGDYSEEEDVLELPDEEEDGEFDDDEPV